MYYITVASEKNGHELGGFKQHTCHLTVWRSEDTVSLGLSTGFGRAVLLAGGAGAPEKLSRSSYLRGMRMEVREGNHFSFRPFCSFSVFYHVHVLLSFNCLKGSHGPVTVI